MAKDLVAGQSYQFDSRPSELASYLRAVSEANLEAVQKGSNFMMTALVMVFAMCVVPFMIPTRWITYSSLAGMFALLFVALIIGYFGSRPNSKPLDSFKIDSLISFLKREPVDKARSDKVQVWLDLRKHTLPEFGHDFPKQEWLRVKGALKGLESYDVKARRSSKFKRTTKILESVRAEGVHKEKVSFFEEQRTEHFLIELKLEKGMKTEDSVKLDLPAYLGDPPKKELSIESWSVENNTISLQLVRPVDHFEGRGDNIPFGTLGELHGLSLIHSLLWVYEPFKNQAEESNM